MKLNIGARNSRIKGFKNLDVQPGKNIDYICDAEVLSQFKDGSIEEIYASHILEHFYHTKTEKVLKEWCRVLKVGGKLYLSVPDWDKIIERLFSKYDIDILGVVGAEKYAGGGVFNSGLGHVFGMVGTSQDNESYVKILSPYYECKMVEVVDGLIMFVDRKYWELNNFDEINFDELFFYDVDFCLRSKKVFVTCDILVEHSKPDTLRGVYPETMKPYEFYSDKFRDKHNFTESEPGDRRCLMIKTDYYNKERHNETYKSCMKKFHL